MDNISFNEPDTTWDQYNLREYPINVNGENTNQKAIIKNGELISIVSDKYMLLPNEEALNQANQIAKQSGLVPFNKFSKLNLKVVGGDEHAVLYGPHNARMHAMYAIEKEYQVNGEDMYVGVGIRNSIDGTKAFGVDLFSFRSACSNMDIIARGGQRGWTLGIARTKMLDTIYKRHTSGLDPKTFKYKELLANVMDRANAIIEAYEQMAIEKATKELLDNIKESRLPNKVLPDYITEESVQAPENLTQWNLYNDITANIWHNQKAAMTSKLFAFGQLHKVIPLQARRV